MGVGITSKEEKLRLDAIIPCALGMDCLLSITKQEAFEPKCAGYLFLRRRKEVRHEISKKQVLTLSA